MLLKWRLLTIMQAWFPWFPNFSCCAQFAIVTVVTPCIFVSLVTLLSGITSMAAANIMLEQIALISSCMDLDGFDK